MSSFQSLKAARASRQKPLIANDVSLAVSQESPASSGARPGPASIQQSTLNQDSTTEHQQHADPHESTSSSATRLQSTVTSANDLYSKELSGLEIRSKPGRGRGIFAGNKVLRAGSILIKTTPVVSALSTAELSKFCSRCFLSSHEIAIANRSAPSKPKRCTGCQALYYCSTTCQNADWTDHKPECRAIKRFHDLHDKSFPDRAKDAEGEKKWILNDGLRAMARVCWGRKRELDSSRKDPDWWKSLDSMESHLSQSSEEEKMKLGYLTQQLVHYLGAADPTSSSQGDILNPAEIDQYGFKSMTDLLNLCSSFKINGFTLSSPNLTPLGVSVSPVVALCNHSCEPNAIVVFPEGGGKGIHLIAIRDIQPGEEILTSYVDVSMPYGERRNDIKERYGFLCDCDLCEKSSSDSKWIDPRWCLRHPGCKSSSEGMVASEMPELSGNGKKSIRCHQCGVEFEIDMSVLKTLIHGAKTIIEADEKRTLVNLLTPDPIQARLSLSTIIPNLQIYLPSSSYPLLPLFRLQASLTPSPTTHGEILNLAQLYMSAYQGALKVYPGGHANLAIVLSEWGKVLSMSLDLDHDWVSNVQGHSSGGVATVSSSSLSSRARESGKSELKGRLEMAIGILRKAVEACLFAFGRENGGGLVGREMRFLLEGCMADLERLR